MILLFMVDTFSYSAVWKSCCSCVFTQYPFSMLCTSVCLPVCRSRNKNSSMLLLLLHKTTLLQGKNFKLFQSDSFPDSVVCSNTSTHISHVETSLLQSSFQPLLEVLLHHKFQVANFEGLRFNLEVLARLCSMGRTLVSEQLMQVNDICSLWEHALQKTSKYGDRTAFKDVSSRGISCMCC